MAAFVERLRALSFDVVSGTATSAIGWGAIVAHEVGAPFVYVRGQAQAHGTGQRVEGRCSPATRVLVVEDLLSTGGSAARTIEALRDEQQAVVRDVFSIVSYDQAEARDMAQVLGVTLHCLVTMHDVLATAEARGHLSAADLASVHAFLRNPTGWQSH